MFEARIPRAARASAPAVQSASIKHAFSRNNNSIYTKPTLNDKYKTKKTIV